MDDVGIFYGHLVFLRPFGIFYGNLVYFSPVLVCCTRENLATPFFGNVRQAQKKLEESAEPTNCLLTIIIIVSIGCHGLNEEKLFFLSAKCKKIVFFCEQLIRKKIGGKNFLVDPFSPKKPVDRN
jgi:hypothetical protein